MADRSATTPWRKLATAVYKGPSDCRIYGSIEVDVTETMEYIRSLRREGTKVTLTHFAAAAIARTLYEDVPDMNGFVRRGKVILRDDVEVFISVALQRGKDMSGVIIPKSQDLTVAEIAEKLVEEVQKMRSGADAGVGSSKQPLSKIPWPIRRPLFLLIKWWVYDLGLKVPFLNIKSDPFGSIMLSDIGSHGLTSGMAALFPIGKIPAVLVMGKAVQKPVVKRGEIQIRTMVTLNATLDHRIVDGAQSGLLAKGIARRLRSPEKLNARPEHLRDIE